LSASETSGFARATEPIEFAFPRDHGAHPDYATEWWYFTGNLFTAEQRHFGFELTLFRVGLRPAQSSTESAWASSAVWMAHLAVTDTARRRFVAEERLSRNGLQLAGATTAPLRIWVEDWSVESVAADSLQLRATGAEIAIDLRLEGLDRIVLQGDEGLDAKGPEPGNASYYYSAPRLTAGGTVTVDSGSKIAVTGLAWMDREWGTSALSPGIEGWDWFALQLDDGRDLMFYRLREFSGGTAEASGGTLRTADGSRLRLAADDVILEPLDYWQSSSTTVSYPVRWNLRIPEQQLELRIEPYLPNQEVDLTVRYWEGAVRVTGTADGLPVSGNGYLELAGY
jgi:predicted secreted hydrolase